MRANDVHDNLAYLSKELISLLAEYKRLNTERAEAEVAYKVAHAEALLKSAGPMEERKARATALTSAKLLEMELAIAKFDNCRAALRVLGQRLDAGRTIASTIRAEAIASGVGT